MTEHRHLPLSGRDVSRVKKNPVEKLVPPMRAHCTPRIPYPKPRGVRVSGEWCRIAWCQAVCRSARSMTGKYRRREGKWIQERKLVLRRINDECALRSTHASPPCGLWFWLNVVVPRTKIPRKETGPKGSIPGGRGCLRKPSVELKRFKKLGKCL